MSKPVLTLPIKADELPSLPACADCAFSEMHEQNDALFYCRRRAPSLMRGDKAIWPVCSGDDWCGEYKQAKNG